MSEKGKPATGHNQDGFKAQGPTVLSDGFRELLKLVPAAAAASGNLSAADVPAAAAPAIDWDAILHSGLAPCLRRMEGTRQDPKWHGEGDVLTHTKMVCETLIESPAWQALERRRQEELFIAALLHDIGKPSCTREEGGRIVSPNHTSVGARLARTVLWRDLGISGTQEAQRFRETVCSLVRYHVKPLYLIEDASPERTAITLAALGGLVPHFTNDLLSILAEADIRGRVSADTAGGLERLGFFREVSEEADCLHKPKAFPSAFSRYAYLSGRDIYPGRGGQPGQDLYDDTWGTVVMLAGLPGTGKDTWIKAACPGMPVVSLDALRDEMGVSPTDPQGQVVNAAMEQAKVYLRSRQEFVWNATNVAIGRREKLVRLFMNYKAKVRIVFLETSWDELLRRNKSREKAVPEPVIERMLANLAPPGPSEAHEVEWLIV
ncbi:MAG: AAA family ATPase [Clostridiales bacterium]|nr:AAA family ATPase [Clostridiales bacterium]